MSFEIDKIKKTLEKNSIEFPHIIQPHKYFSNREHIDLPRTIGYLQVTMRSALFFFLNGSYWLGNHFSVVDLIYPLHDRADPKVINSFLVLKDIVTKVAITSGIFEEFSYRLNRIQKTDYSNKTIASLFESFYREFEQIISELDTMDCLKKTVNGCVEKQNYPPEDWDYLSPIFELKKYSEKYFTEFVKGFYLHGSLATMDYIPYWSDLDTFMIISKDTIRHPEQLLELRRRSLQSHTYLYQIDHHQLHGHLLISEFDLDYYPQTFFPTVLLDYSQSFSKDHNPLVFNLRDCTSERLAAFWNDAVLYFANKAIQGKNCWRTLTPTREKKLFFHRIMTFPLFYLQAKGIHAYKKHSFQKAMTEFSKDDWGVVQEISSIMKHWGYSYDQNKYLKIVGDINPKLFFLMVNKCYDVKYQFEEGAFKDFHKNFHRWIDSALKLSFSGWENVSKK